MQLQNHHYLRTGLTKDEEWLITRILLNTGEMRFVDLLNDWHRDYGNFSANALLRLISFIEGPNNLLEKVTKDNTLYINLSDIGKFYHLDGENQLYLNYPIYLHIDRAYLTEHYTYNKNIGISYGWLLNEYGLLPEAPTSELSLYPTYYVIENKPDIEQQLLTKGYANYTLTLPYTYVKRLERLELLTPGKYSTKPLKRYLYGITEEFMEEHLERLGYLHIVEARYQYYTDKLETYPLLDVINSSNFAIENLTTCEKEKLEELYKAEVILNKNDYKITQDSENYYVELTYATNTLRIVSETDIQHLKEKNMLTKGLRYQIKNPLTEWVIVANSTHIKVSLSTLEEKAKRLNVQNIKIHGIFPCPSDFIHTTTYKEAVTEFIDEIKDDISYTASLPIDTIRESVNDVQVALPTETETNPTYYFINSNGTLKVCEFGALYTRNSIVKSTVIPTNTELVNIHCIEASILPNTVNYILLITKNGYIKAVPTFEFKAKHRASKYVRSIRLDYDDRVVYSELLNEQSQLKLLVNGKPITYNLLDIVSTKMNKGRYIGDSNIQEIEIINQEIVADIL